MYFCKQVIVTVKRFIEEHITPSIQQTINKEFRALKRNYEYLYAKLMELEQEQIILTKTAAELELKILEAKVENCQLGGTSVIT